MAARITSRHHCFDHFTGDIGQAEVAATRWLIAAGIKDMGTDAWGWDQPFWAMKERFLRTKNPEVIWEAHRVGAELEYGQLEKLANLDKLPHPCGFKVSCFPVKLTGGSAGWSRVVAVLNDH